MNDKTICLFSIHRVYCDRILSGEKTYEYRKRCPEWLTRGCEIALFSSDSPETLLAVFEVGEILSDSPEEIWRRTCAAGGIDHETYMRYYEGHPKAFAFGIHNVRSIKSGITVAAIMGSDWEPHSFALLTAGQADAIRKIIVCTESQGICPCTC